ncbi:MAG TPA: hypothetical protein VIM69_10570 [Opitutaceae bacterium]
MVAKAGKQGAFALNLGLLTHVGSYDSVDEAQEALRAWREDPNFNRMGVFCFIIPLTEAETA